MAGFLIRGDGLLGVAAWRVASGRPSWRGVGAGRRRWFCALGGRPFLSFWVSCTTYA